MTIDFVSLGIQAIAAVPSLRCVELAAPNAVSLYKRRQEAVAGSTSEYMCFVDGGPDVIADDFVTACESLADRMQEKQVPIGYMAETIHGAAGSTAPFVFSEYLRDVKMIHHGVVCSVAALRAIPWPVGCFHWEAIAYGVLAQQGFVYDPVARYDWRPGPGGASGWPTILRARVNSARWLQGLPVPVLPGDL
jgi:hypothetical protein